MLTKVGTAAARKNLARIINRVAFGKEIFVLTRRGEPLAAIVSVEDLKRLQDLEDIEDAQQARIESEERISWNDLKAERSL